MGTMPPYEARQNSESTRTKRAGLFLGGVVLTAMAPVSLYEGVAHNMQPLLFGASALILGIAGIELLKESMKG